MHQRIGHAEAVTAMFASLRAAIGFLTRVPVGKVASEDAERSFPWFPLVGAMIGAATGGVYVAARHGLPPTVSAALAIAVGLLLTGAFHYDGLADMADAFGGGWTREQRLTILKDSRHGTYGVASLVIILIIQVQALAALNGRHGLLVLVAAESLGRAAAIGMMLVMRPAREDGLAATSTAQLNRLAFVVGITSGIGIAVAAITWWAPVSVVAAIGAVVIVGLLAHRKIGGVVGDVLGAGEQIAYTAVLLVCVALAAHHR